MLQPSHQHRAWIGLIQASQPACYANCCSVSARCNLCPQAAAFACKGDTTPGCRLTNTSLQSSREKNISQRKNEHLFPFHPTLYTQSAVTGAILFCLCHSKVKIKHCQARTAAPCSHCDCKQSRFTAAREACNSSGGAGLPQGRWQVKPWPGSQGTVWHGQWATKVDLLLHNTPRGVSPSDPRQREQE